MNEASSSRVNRGLVLFAEGTPLHKKMLVLLEETWKRALPTQMLRRRITSRTLYVD